MSQATYAIPALQAECFDFQRNAFEIIPGNATAWGIPPETITLFTSQHSDYESKYLITSNFGMQSPIATASRDAAWQLLKGTMREIYEKYLLYNDAVDAESKEALHIHSFANGGGTISPAPQTTPIITLVAKQISVLHVVYSDSATPSSNAKPENVAFCELVFKIDLPAPESPRDCPEGHFISRSNSPIVFEPEQRGKKVHGYARWVNKNGKVGPWSGMITAIVP